jgi:hypothetical protein
MWNEDASERALQIAREAKETCEGIEGNELE